MNYNQTDYPSEININLTYEKEIISIQIANQLGEAPELKTVHERQMHFVILSNNLEVYKHLHAKNHGNGLFTINQKLDLGTYTVFIDITPVHDNYVIEPIKLQVGDKVTYTKTLDKDTQWEKYNHDIKIKLEPVESRIHERIPLEFKMYGKKP